jgi:hypothetical protein
MPQLLQSLQKEVKDTRVGVHVLSPGMVLTDLLLSGVRSSHVDGDSRCFTFVPLLQNKQASTLKLFNILAEHPRTVAKWAVPRMRGIATSDPKQNGLYLRYLTPMGVVGRFLTVFSRKNRLIDESTGKMVTRD